MREVSRFRSTKLTQPQREALGSLCEYLLSSVFYNPLEAGAKHRPPCL